MSRIAALLIFCCLGAALQAAPMAVDPARTLLEQARLWQSLNRPLEAQQALDKLARIAPVQPQVSAEALTLQALVQVQKHQDREVTHTLALLKQRYPGHPGIRQIEQLRRVMGPERNKLLAARSLFNNGKIEAAYAAFNALYQGPPPQGALTLEYWQLVARLPGNGWARSQAALKQLIRESPSNHQNRLALASTALLHPPVSPAVLAEFKALAMFDDSRSDALGYWRRALLQVDGELPLSAYLTYLKVAPDDQLISDKLQALEQSQRKQRELLADPAYRALLAASVQLDNNQLPAAEKSLQQAAVRYAKLPAFFLNQGRLREKQGRYADAIAAYRQGQATDKDAENWPQRIVGAQVASLLAQAERSMQQARWSAARSLLDRAAQLQPDNIDLLLDRAQWYGLQQQGARAEILYRQALRRAPDNGRALAGLLQVYLQAERFQDAERWLLSLPLKQQRALGASYQAARAQVERASGDRLLAAGQLTAALPHLQRAVALQPENVWNRFALANAWLAAGETQRGLDALRQLAQAPRASAESLFAYALFLAKVDAGPQALASLQRIPVAERSDGMLALQRRVWLRETLNLVDAGIALGQMPQALQRLQQTEQQVQGDPVLLPDVAQAWVRAGDADHGRQLMLSQYVSQPTTDNALAYIAVLLDLGETRQAASLLAQSSAPATPEQQTQLASLQSRLAVQQAEQAEAAGQLGQATEILQHALQAKPEDARLLRSLAALDLRTGRLDLARSRLQQVLAQTANDDEARLLLVDLESQSGQMEAARAGLDALLTATPAPSLDFRLRVLSRLNALGDGERVDREVAQLLSRGKNHPGVAQLAARRARQRGQSDQALGWYRSGFLPSVPLPTGQADVSALPLAQQPLRPVFAESASQEDLHQEYAELLDLRSAAIWQGLDLTYRSASNGTPGQSQMTMWQAPLLVEVPGQNEGKYFLRSDSVDIKAGSLHVQDSYARQHFGAIALCQDQAACASRAGSQQASGSSLGLGYQNQHWQLDIGTTPRNFPVSTTVGGVKYSDSVSVLNYHLELARRPVTSSLLSYAGTRDPYTGQIWGGVHTTGVMGGLGYDQGGKFGIWSSFGYQLLAGQNVADNSKLTAMGGVYWRLFKTPVEQLTLGLNSINFWYRKNLGEFTFGQGGYYSPQRYNALSVPLSYAWRNERWSTLLRGSVSVSSAKEDASPFYPTRPDLQAASGRMTSASSGPGWGASATAALEYQLTPKLALGAMLEYQYSQFYQPGRAMLYLRYQPGSASRPLSLPVEPMQTYANF